VRWQLVAREAGAAAGAAEAAAESSCGCGYIDDGWMQQQRGHDGADSQIPPLAIPSSKDIRNFLRGASTSETYQVTGRLPVSCRCRLPYRQRAAATVSSSTHTTLLSIVFRSFDSGSRCRVHFLSVRMAALLYETTSLFPYGSQTQCIRINYDRLKMLNSCCPIIIHNACLIKTTPLHVEEHRVPCQRCRPCVSLFCSGIKFESCSR
jgi:hypothetical protein